MYFAKGYSRLMTSDIAETGPPPALIYRGKPRYYQARLY